MPTKIEAALTADQFRAFCDELLGLPGEQRTLRGIQDAAKRHGITVSHEGAKSFKQGPFARYIEKIEAGRQTREALVAAAGVGVHPLDAIEEATVLELQDHLTGGVIDVAFVTKQLVGLRTSISMREESRRKQRDLERKLADSEAARANDARRVALLEERMEIMQLDAASAVQAHAKEIRLVIVDKSLDGPARTERVRRILFGERPATWKPITDKGAPVE